MGKLIVLIKPLLHVMAVAILLGVTGYLCAISLTVLGAGALGMATGGFLSDTVKYLAENVGVSSKISDIMTAMILVAVFRGVFHYIEQYCNHFIAFKLLAVIRHKVFAALRKLCPAKLEGRDKGNLISIITTDIELLEVFYAHTISPIAIAFVVSGIMVVFIGSYSLAAGIFALIAYIVVGIVIPLINGKRGSTLGMKFRNAVGELSSFVLGELRGIDETIQYGAGEKKKKAIYDKSVNLAKIQEELAEAEGRQRGFTNGAIQLFSYGMLLLTLILYSNSLIEFEAVVICTVAMMSSFGSVVALSALSNNLNQTLASGERVLALLEEEPEVAEVETGKDSISLSKFTGVKAKNVNFSYGDKKILEDFTLDIKKDKILGIHGASGSGKSTFLKLLMRFWETDSGEILISDKDIKKIVTEDLRKLEGYVTQETHLFTGTIAENIALGKPEAKLSEIKEAAKAASIDKFIETLRDGYETKVGELGDTLSSGEKQRLGIARAFLYNAPFILLDEPTSNLDSLNEGIILKALREKSKGRTILLVSHRDSTMNIVDEMVEMG
nr:ABC transporter ATP-binding protein [uncultured Catonella sp.]